jgi:hypothetical protein
LPTPGLSLVGFIADQHQAFNHLINACVPSDASHAAIAAEWEAAKVRRRCEPIPNAGHPDIRPLDGAQSAYVQQVLAHPIFQSEWRGAVIQLVEIDTLHQVTIDSSRSAHHCASLSNPPTADELMAVCLPLTPQPEQLKLITGQGQNSLLVKARSLNVRILQGVGNQDFLGIQFGLAIPFVHVVRLNGRCYLFNGYHRAVGIRDAGCTHMPCVVRNIADHNAIGLHPPDTFDAVLLDSDDPPAVAHFTQRRAHPVSLRCHSRILYVNWAEHVVPDE